MVEPAAASTEVGIDLSDPDVIVRTMLTLDRAADDFLGDCRRRGYSTRTIQTYRRTYDELADRLPLDYDVSKITTDDLRRYLTSKSHLANGTIAGHEAHLSSLFDWMLRERKIGKNPMALLPRTRRTHPIDLDVKTISGEEVGKLLSAASSWPEKLCLGILAYLGPRRHAVATLRLSDYDEERGLMRFREKGGKTIWKPVPDELANLIAAARTAGAFDESDYLVPPSGPLYRSGVRDDRVIWRLVKQVAKRAGVDCHVHALRAAFAVFYEEQNPSDTMALRDLMGHRSVQTTEIYLRRRNKQVGMERVRSLSWGVNLAEHNGKLVRTVG